MRCIAQLCCAPHTYCAQAFGPHPLLYGSWLGAGATSVEAEEPRGPAGHPGGPRCSPSRVGQVASHAVRALRRCVRALRRCVCARAAADAQCMQAEAARMRDGRVELQRAEVCRRPWACIRAGVRGGSWMSFRRCHGEVHVGWHAWRAGRCHTDCVHAAVRECMPTGRPLSLHVVRCACGGGRDFEQACCGGVMRGHQAGGLGWCTPRVWRGAWTHGRMDARVQSRMSWRRACGRRPMHVRCRAGTRSPGACVL